MGQRGSFTVDLDGGFRYGMLGGGWGLGLV